MAYEFTGTVKIIKPIQTFKSGFQKQEVVLEDDNPERPNEVAFMFKHKLPLVATIREGDRVTIAFSVGGHEWNGRHFVELLAHEVYREGEAAPPPPAPAKPADDPADPTTWHNQQPAGQSDSQEELPF